MFFLDEAMNDFYKQQKFYTAAKKYKPELKKQILAFLHQKGVGKVVQNAYSRDKELNFSELDTVSKKDKKERFRELVHKGTEIKAGFFSTNSGYEAAITFPLFDYKGWTFKVQIESNETFFDDGHDLKIEMYLPEDSYGSKRNYTYKVDTFQPIAKTLEDIWGYVLQSLNAAALPKEEKAKTDTPNRRSAESDVVRMVRVWLNTYFKELKSGKKTEIDSDKQDAVFFIQSEKYQNTGTDYNAFSSTGRGGHGFTIKFKIRHLSKNFAPASKYSRSSPPLSPEILAIWPNAKEWVSIYRDFLTWIHDTGRIHSYQSTSLSSIFGDKSYSEEHKKIYEKLKIVVKRILKLGYYPDHFSKPYGPKDEYAKLSFKYAPKFKAQAEKDPTVIDKFLNSERNNVVKDGFFYNGRLLEDVPRDLIKNIFKH